MPSSVSSAKSAEDRVILRLSRGHTMRDVCNLVRSFEYKPLNWDLILERVIAEEVYPLFYRNLMKLQEQRAGSREDGPTPDSQHRAPNTRYPTAYNQPV